MQKLSIKKLTILNTIALVAICCFLVYKSFEKEKKIVYVDNIKLFDSFEMTKEMKRIGEKEFNSKKMIVDSLYVISQSTNLDDSDKARIVQEFVQKRDELEQFSQYFASEEANKIWSRLQSYSQAFALEKGYKAVLGSENKKNVLFADESIDVTNELIKFSNKRYEGLK